MSNGNLPAYPVHEVISACSVDGNSGPYDFSVVHAGLTKREKFAMNAPDAVPTWFTDMNHDLTARERFFQWRSYYADMMLAELERTK